MARGFQNTYSSRAQRRSRRTGVDDYPTPPWATRALGEYVLDLTGARVWEPACGRGHMASALTEYAEKVFASDIKDYGFGDVRDFFACDASPYGPIDWIVTNPMFKQMDNCIENALRIATRGIAILGRIQLLEGVGRYNSVYKPWKGHFTHAPFVERVPMVRGRVDPEATTATAYGWLVIDKLVERPLPLIHIPPCRRRLEKPDDFMIGRAQHAVERMPRRRRARKGEYTGGEDAGRNEWVDRS